MKKLFFILAAFSICFTGCTAGYRVHVNGFSERYRQIKDKSSVFVSEDPNSQNPIFDKEIKEKIKELLKWYDYVPVSAVEKADYRLTFQVRMDSHHSSGFTPLHHPYAGFRTGYWRDYHFGYTTYVPYYDTFYDQRLIVKVFERKKSPESDSEQVVWFGEAMVSTSGDDIRRTIDYLLVGCFEYFGADTTRQKSLYVTEKDPRIIRIEFVR